MPTPVEDPRFIAAIDVLRRTGLVSFQIRYSDDAQPPVWLAVGEWRIDKNGRPVPRGGEQTYYECCAGMDPLKAVLRLADQMIDGGQCAHCRRPSAISDDWRSPLPLSRTFCWYVYDPETEKYRRSCEGAAT